MKLSGGDLTRETKLSIMRLALDKMRHDNEDANLLDELDSLCLSDLDIFCRRLPMTVDISLDTFRDALERLHYTRRTDQLLREFVRRGASNGVLHKLFGVSKLQAEQIKSQEGLSGKFIGRPRLPSGDVRGQIFRKWEELSREENDLRTRYLQLSDIFPDITISSLHQTIRKEKKEARQASILAEALLS